MKIYFPKPVKLNLTIFFLLTAAAVIIYSCRRDNKSNSPAAGTVAQAKAWYESAYPVLVNNNGSLITQSTGGSHDISQWVKPDWLHTASYARLGKNVIEMPIDPNSKFGSTLKIGTKLLNKTYSRSYFLLLNDGKNYEAYIFTILADSDYVNNDLSKLAHNTYRKLDANFSGKLLYFTPKGAYLGGYGYKNGQLLAPPAVGNQQTGTQQVQSLNSNKLKPDNIVQECTEWYIAYYEDGVFQYADYLTTTCHDVDDGSDGGSNSPPPPPPCPAGSHPGPPVTPPCIPALNPETVNSGHLTTNNLIPPPPPPDDGAPPPPSQTPCSVDGPAKPCPVVDTITEVFCDGLTSAQRSSIQQTVSAFETYDCASKFLTNFFKGKTFSFCISPGAYNAIYNPLDNSITFSTDDAATPAFASVLEHEFFHAFQNSTYPGGTSGYGKNPVTNVASAGFVNIEFEQEVFHDIATGNKSAFINGTQQQKDSYSAWIDGLTSGGTAYPKLTPSSSGYTDFINNYNSFLNQYNAIPGNANSSPAINLTPQALIDLFNNTNPNC